MCVEDRKCCRYNVGTEESGRGFREVVNIA
jgi:hypothetical protein